MFITIAIIVAVVIGAGVGGYFLLKDNETCPKEFYVTGKNPDPDSTTDPTTDIETDPIQVYQINTKDKKIKIGIETPNGIMMVSAFNYDTNRKSKCISVDNRVEVHIPIEFPEEDTSTENSKEDTSTEFLEGEAIKINTTIIAYLNDDKTATIDMVIETFEGNNSFSAIQELISKEGRWSVKLDDLIKNAAIIEMSPTSLLTSLTPE